MDFEIWWCVFIRVRKFVERDQEYLGSIDDQASAEVSAGSALHARSWTEMVCQERTADREAFRTAVTPPI